MREGKDAGNWHDKCTISVAEAPQNNRTFTTWQDLGDLKNKIVDMGKWTNFLHFAKREYKLEVHGYKSPIVHTDWFINWLLDPIRFCELVAEWWKEWRTK